MKFTVVNARINIKRKERIMKICILDKSSMGEDTPFDDIYKFGDVEIFDSTSASETLKRVADADVIITNKVKITADVINASNSLKLICVFATGYDNIDISAARARGIAVCNVPGYSTDSVALLTVATALSLYSHLGEYNEYVRSGEYSASGVANRLIPVFHELKGKTWGIVGYGNIGKAVGKVADAFGMRVIVNKRSPINDALCVDIDTLCKESDIISLHCPLNDGTRNLINEEKLNLMKSSAILVNEARGAVVDEKAVAKAIKNGRIGGFGCDVYSAEPFSKEHPYSEIMNFKNVILTPHAAWGAYEARVRCVKTIANNISGFLSKKSINRVDI